MEEDGTVKNGLILFYCFNALDVIIPELFIFIGF